jgi:hypothetical protein
MRHLTPALRTDFGWLVFRAEFPHALWVIQSEFQSIRKSKHVILRAIENFGHMTAQTLKSGLLIALRTLSMFSADWPDTYK